MCGSQGNFCRLMVIFVGNRSLKRRMASLQLRIEEHKAKISIESKQKKPDQGLITH